MQATTCICAESAPHLRHHGCFQFDSSPAPRVIVRPWLILVPTYRQHFRLALNLCRSIAAFAEDRSAVSLRLIVSDDDEAAALHDAARGYNASGVQVQHGSRCTVSSAKALDVQALTIARAAAPFGGLRGLLFNTSDTNAQGYGMSFKPGCRSDSNKFLWQFLKKLLAARYCVGSRGMLVLDSEAEALPRPFRVEALFREYHERPFALLSASRQGEHCSCASMLGRDDPMAKAPWAYPSSCRAERASPSPAEAVLARSSPPPHRAPHSTTGALPQHSPALPDARPAWEPARCAADRSAAESAASYHLGSYARTPWGYGGWFWTHEGLAAMVDTIESAHGGTPLIEVARRTFYHRGRCFEPTLYWMHEHMRGVEAAEARAAAAARFDAHAPPRDASGGALTASEPSALQARASPALTLYTPECVLARYLPPSAMPPNMPPLLSLEFLPVFLFSNSSRVLDGVRRLIDDLQLSFLRLPPLDFNAHDFQKWSKRVTENLHPTHLGYGYPSIESLFHSHRFLTELCPLFLHNLVALLQQSATVRFLVSEALPERPCGARAPAVRWRDVLARRLGVRASAHSDHAEPLPVS